MQVWAMSTLLVLPPKPILSHRSCMQGCVCQQRTCYTAAAVHGEAPGLAARPVQRQTFTRCADFRSRSCYNCTIQRALALPRLRLEVSDHPIAVQRQSDRLNDTLAPAPGLRSASSGFKWAHSFDRAQEVGRKRDAPGGWL